MTSEIIRAKEKTMQDATIPYIGDMVSSYMSSRLRRKSRETTYKKAFVLMQIFIAIKLIFLFDCLYTSYYLVPFLWKCRMRGMFTLKLNVSLVSAQLSTVWYKFCHIVQSVFVHVQTIFRVMFLFLYENIFILSSCRYLVLPPNLTSPSVRTKVNISFLSMCSGICELLLRLNTNFSLKD